MIKMLFDTIILLLLLWNLLIPILTIKTSQEIYLAHFAIINQINYIGSVNNFWWLKVVFFRSNRIFFGDMLAEADIKQQTKNRLIDKPNLPLLASVASVNISVAGVFDYFTWVGEQTKLKLRQNLDNQTSELAIGMLLGDTKDLDVNLKRKIKLIGMQHVTSASGYNVTVVLSCGMLLFERYLKSKKWRLICSVGLILSYVTMVGFTPPLIRAALMATLGLLATNWWQRQYQPGRALIGVGILMVVADPNFLSSLSFQLTMAATAGILWLTRIVKWWSDIAIDLCRRFINQIFLFTTQASDVNFRQTEYKLNFKNSVPQSWWQLSWSLWLHEVYETAIVTLSATLATFPIIWLWFGQFSSWSLLANISLLWLTPLITVASWYYSWLCWLIPWPPLMGLANLLLWLPSQLFINGVNWWAGVAGNLFQTKNPTDKWWGSGLWLLIMSILVVGKWSIEQRRK